MLEAIVQPLRAKYPSALGDFMAAREAMHEHGRTWPAWCWIPMSASASYVPDWGGPMSDIAALHAVTLWRLDRAVLDVDEDSAMHGLEICGPADKSNPTIWRDLPISPIAEAARSLPVWCPYLAAPARLRQFFHGMWVHMEFDFATGRPELRLLIDKDGTRERLLPVAIYLDRPTLGRALADMVATGFASGPDRRGMDLTGVPGPEADLLGATVHGILPVLLGAFQPGHTWIDSTGRVIQKEPKPPTSNTVWRTRPWGPRSF